MSDLGSLSECLVDNDPTVRVRARRLRSKAFALSIALEAGILAAVLVWPLIAPGVLTAHYIVTPAPPYSGGGAAHHEQTAMHRPHASPFPPICLAVCAPVVRPSLPANSSEAPDIGPGQGGGSEGPGLPGEGPSLPGGTGDHASGSGAASPRGSSRSTDANRRRRDGSNAHESSGAAISAHGDSGAYFRHSAFARDHRERRHRARTRSG